MSPVRNLILRFAVFAITRDIFILPRIPELYKQCIDTIVEYIGEKYGTSVDAIVAPETKGFLIASGVASKLNLPFIPIRKAGKLSRHSDDLVQATYKCRMNKVNCMMFVYFITEIRNKLFSNFVARKSFCLMFEHKGSSVAYDNFYGFLEMFR